MKILSYDLETFPNVAYVWGKYEQDVIEYVEEGHLLSWSAKWLGGKLITKGLDDYPGYKSGSRDDKALVKDLHELFNEADILIAHNGDQFDIRKANERFLHYALPPPEPYKTIDTKKVAKRYFYFNSNSLNELGKHLGLGEKVKHPGFQLWLDCKAADPKAWALMKKYNKQDVVLLEQIYIVLRPWIQTHPPVAMRGSCPNCGSPSLQSRGQGFNKRGSYNKYQCKNCGAWSTGPREGGRETSPRMPNTNVTRTRTTSRKHKVLVHH